MEYSVVCRSSCPTNCMSCKFSSLHLSRDFFFSWHLCIATESREWPKFSLQENTITWSFPLSLILTGYDWGNRDFSSHPIIRLCDQTRQRQVKFMVLLSQRWSIWKWWTSVGRCRFIEKKEMSYQIFTFVFQECSISWLSQTIQATAAHPFLIQQELTHF